jgi:hypothetical protein
MPFEALLHVKCRVHMKEIQPDFSRVKHEIDPYETRSVGTGRFTWTENALLVDLRRV